MQSTRGLRPANRLQLPLSTPMLQGWQISDNYLMLQTLRDFFQQEQRCLAPKLAMQFFSYQSKYQQSGKRQSWHLRASSPPFLLPSRQVSVCFWLSSTVVWRHVGSSWIAIRAKRFRKYALSSFCQLCFSRRLAPSFMLDLLIVT